MIHSYFSSENFRPKRLVYVDTFGDIANKNHKQEKAAKAEAQKALEKDKNVRRRANLKAGIRLRPEDPEKADKKFEKNKDGVKKFLKNSGEYAGWRKWNREYAGKMGLSVTKARQNIMALQKKAIEMYGLQGDPAAVADGKLGPYTRVLLAKLAGVKKDNLPDVPNADHNTRLVAAKEIPNKPKSSSEEVIVDASAKKAASPQKGLGLLKGAEVKGDGSYLIKTGSKETYFKMIDGKWKWASKTQWEKKDWQDVGKDKYNEKGMESVDRLSDRLANLDGTSEVEIEEGDDAQRKRDTIAAAIGTLDPNYEWFVVKSATSSTGYKMQKWKPFTSSKKVGIENPQISNMKVGDKSVLSIGGEKFAITCTNSTRGVLKYSMEGVNGEFGIQALHAMAIKKVEKEKNKTKPEGVPIGQVPKRDFFTENKKISEENPQISNMKVGDKSVLSIGGEKFAITCTNSTRGVLKYSMEGVNGEFSWQALFNKAVEKVKNKKKKQNNS